MGQKEIALATVFTVSIEMMSKEDLEVNFLLKRLVYLLLFATLFTCLRGSFKALWSKCKNSQIHTERLRPQRQKSPGMNVKLQFCLLCY